jgi:hypothetical protein
MSKATALSDLSTRALGLMVADLYGREPICLPDVDREAIVRSWQRNVGKIKADGWPGSGTLRALWERHKPKRADVLAHAVAALSWPRNTYRLGKGGYGWLPDLHTPQLVTDCSGFAAICLGRSRRATGPDLGDMEWIETTQLVRDATGPQRLVRAVSLDDLLPGDLIAHGDSGGRQGHVAVVEHIDEHGRIHTIESCGATATESSIRRRERTKRWRSKRAIGLRPVWYA